MEIILIISALIFLVFGAVLLLGPRIIETVAEKTDKIVLFIDEYVRKRNKPVAYVFLGLCIFLWYVAWWKGQL